RRVRNAEVEGSIPFCSTKQQVWQFPETSKSPLLSGLFHALLRSDPIRKDIRMDTLRGQQFPAS
ncbi:MAG: hypothetical protein RKP20_15285, partial [Candidatus Competibacter sp.]|nr:hypothetical protein [Candidatus Competibacter sp.]